MYLAVCVHFIVKGVVYDFKEERYFVIKSWKCKQVGCPYVRVCDAHRNIARTYIEQLARNTIMANNTSIRFVNGTGQYCSGPFEFPRCEATPVEVSGEALNQQFLGFQAQVAHQGPAAHGITFSSPLSRAAATLWAQRAPVELLYQALARQQAPPQPKLVWNVQEVEQEQLVEAGNQAAPNEVGSNPPPVPRGPGPIANTWPPEQVYSANIRQRFLSFLRLQQRGYRPEADQAILDSIAFYLDRGETENALVVIEAIEESAHTSEPLRHGLTDFFLNTPHLDTILDETFRRNFFYNEGTPRARANGNANGSNANGENTNASNVNGENTNASNVNGENTNVSNVNGENTNASNVNGENTNASNVNGENASAENANGENATGENANGENANGENANGEIANGEKANGENVNGENANGENTNGETANKATPNDASAKVDAEENANGENRTSTGNYDSDLESGEETRGPARRPSGVASISAEASARAASRAQGCTSDPAGSSMVNSGFVDRFADGITFEANEIVCSDPDCCFRIPRLSRPKRRDGPKDGSNGPAKGGSDGSSKDGSNGSSKDGPEDDPKGQAQ